jgi:hypothetical protein
MGLLDRIFGNRPEAESRARPMPSDRDSQALERYRYMLQTAPPETLEQAHAEAFAKLSPEQRRQLLAELSRAAPENERNAVGGVSSEDPKALGRAATRAEIRQPGTMERILGGSSGMGMGAGLLGSFAAAFAGSMIANSFFSALGGFGDEAGDTGDDHTAADANADEADQDLADADGDAGGFDGMDFDV